MNAPAAPFLVLSGLPSALLYPGVVFLHVLAAVVLTGSALQFVWTRRALRGAASVEELRGGMDAARRSAAANPVAALTLLATGAYLGTEGWWREPWFQVALAVWILDATWAARRAHGAAMELGRAAAAAAPGPVPASLDRLRWSPAHDVPHDVLLAGDLAMLFVMVMKPGLVGSCAALLVANGAAVLLRRRRRAARDVTSVRAPPEVATGT